MFHLYGCSTTYRNYPKCQWTSILKDRFNMGLSFCYKPCFRLCGCVIYKCIPDFTRCHGVWSFVLIVVMDTDYDQILNIALFILFLVQCEACVDINHLQFISICTFSFLRAKGQTEHSLIIYFGTTFISLTHFKF